VAAGAQAAQVGPVVAPALALGHDVVCGGARINATYPADRLLLEGLPPGLKVVALVAFEPSASLPRDALMLCTSPAANSNIRASFYIAYFGYCPNLQAKAATADGLYLSTTE